MINDIWDLIMVIGLSMALIFDLAFIVANHFWVDWRSNPWGRHVMLFSYAFAAVLLVCMARVVFGDYIGRRQLRAVFWLSIGLVMGQRVWMVCVQHHRAKVHRG